LRLQTANAESVVWEKRLIEHSQRSPLSAAVFASSPEEVVSKSKALKALPSVVDVENVFSTMPQHQEEKIPLLRSLLEVIPEIRMTQFEARPSDVAELQELLARIRFKMQEEQASKQGADPTLVDQMNQVRMLAAELLQIVKDSPNAETRFNEYRQRFREDLLNTWEFLRAGAAARPMTIEDLPDTLRDWFYHDGQYLIRIYPKESIWEEGTLNRFVTALQRLDPKTRSPSLCLRPLLRRLASRHPSML
jgi:hypothetical protein